MRRRQQRCYENCFAKRLRFDKIGHFFPLKRIEKKHEEQNLEWMTDEGGQGMACEKQTASVPSMCIVYTLHTLHTHTQ